MPSDTTPLGGGARAARPAALSAKMLAALFALFLLVSSDAFVHSVISRGGAGTMRDRELTAWGAVVQGVFLVVAYALAAYLVEQGIL